MCSVTWRKRPQLLPLWREVEVGIGASRERASLDDQRVSPFFLDVLSLAGPVEDPEGRRVTTLSDPNIRSRARRIVFLRKIDPLLGFLLRPDEVFVRVVVNRGKFLVHAPGLSGRKFVDVRLRVLDNFSVGKKVRRNSVVEVDNFHESEGLVRERALYRES